MKVSDSTHIIVPILNTLAATAHHRNPSYQLVHFERITKVLSLLEHYGRIRYETLPFYFTILEGILLQMPDDITSSEYRMVSEYLPVCSYLVLQEYVCADNDLMTTTQGYILQNNLMGSMDSNSESLASGYRRFKDAYGWFYGVTKNVELFNLERVAFYSERLLDLEGAFLVRAPVKRMLRLSAGSSISSYPRVLTKGWVIDTNPGQRRIDNDDMYVASGRGGIEFKDWDRPTI